MGRGPSKIQSIQAKDCKSLSHHPSVFWAKHLPSTITTPKPHSHRGNCLEIDAFKFPPQEKFDNTYMILNFEIYPVLANGA